MNSIVANNTLEEIDRQIIEIESFQSGDKERSYFAKYLVVFICGCYESIIEAILCEYAEKHHDTRIVDYISKSLDLNFKNPDIEKIILILDRFDKQWALEINNMPYVNKTAINSIVTNKNELAHRGSSTITMASIKEFYSRSKPIIEKVDAIVLALKISPLYPLHQTDI